MNDLKGKTAIVTGASRGIGKEIAIQLAARGADVAINYRSSDREANEVAEAIRAHGVEALVIQADVSEPDQARALISQVHDAWKRVDILINNAGITRDKTLRKLTDEDWETVIKTNLGSVYSCCTAALPIMIEQKFGRIVNITSFVGQAGNFGQSNYAASKGGIIAFTKTAALEVAKHNVTVNCIAPGFTETDMLRKVPDEVREKIISRIPMQRFGQPEEIARAVVFIAAEGSYITGQQINVNGGVYM